MRILSALRYDVKFQLRHGFYYAYALISALYIAALRLLPPGVKEYAATLIVFSDPSVLGFFFIGGIVLLEKGQNTLESLFVTPFTPEEYIASKLISLTALSLATSVIIMIASFGLRIRLLPLLLGVVLSSLFFTLAGFSLACKARNLNDYIFKSVLYLSIFIFPLLEYLNLAKFALFTFLPTKGSLILLQGTFESLGAVDVVYSICILAVWIVAAFILARDWLRKYVLLGIGGSGL